MIKYKPDSEGGNRTQTDQTPLLYPVWEEIKQRLFSLNPIKEHDAWEKCTVCYRSIQQTVEITLHRENDRVELDVSPLEIPLLLEHLKKEMYKQAPHEGAWTHCSYAFYTSPEKADECFFNYDDRRFFSKAELRTDVLVNEFESFPRSRRFTPDWWRIILGENTYYTIFPGTHEMERWKNEFVRTQHPDPDMIQVLEDIEQEVRELLEDSGETGWEKCIICMRTMYGGHKPEIWLQERDGTEQYFIWHDSAIQYKIRDIKKKMYKQNPQEGAFIHCLLTLWKDTEKSNIAFNYDDLLLFNEEETDTEMLDYQLEDFPRGRAFTPTWLQEIVTKKSRYLS